MAQIINTPRGRPLSHTVPRVCELTGYGPTTVWKLIADGRLDVVRVPGIRRTLVTDESLVRLIAPPSTVEPQRRRRSRPRKTAQPAAAPVSHAPQKHEPPRWRRSTLEPQRRRRGRPRKTAQPE